MRPATIVVAAAVLLLAGCSPSWRFHGGSDGGRDDHSTAGTGWGLGPQDFNSNGGAFGPDQLSPSHNEGSGVGGHGRR